VNCDGYGTGGISKYTLSASDPIDDFSFLKRYFPVNCQDSGSSPAPCNREMAGGCGEAGRAALCVDEACSQPAFGDHVFGLHLVNLSSRPYGVMDNVDVERHFTDKLDRAFHAQAYDASMDFSVVMYAQDLDRYAEAFRKDTIPFLALIWVDDAACTWYSLIAQVAKSQMIIEIVSNIRPSSVTSFVADELQRLPAVVFKRNNVSTVSPTLLTALAISKGVSNLEDVAKFYEEEMFATPTHQSKQHGNELRTFTLPHSSLVVRLVERPASATTGAFKIADLEKAKHSAHEMSNTDIFCRVDKWYDNHFAYDNFWNITLDEYKAAFDANDRIYHVFGNCTAESFGPGTNMYVVDPTGDTIQVDGHWIQCPHGGSGDALLNPCSQGNCSEYQASTRCKAKLEELCAFPTSNQSACLDCSYLNWAQMLGVGCHNADVVNYCTSGIVFGSAIAMI